jgi:hypothetical protein
MSPGFARNAQAFANVACAVLALACLPALSQPERDPTAAPQQSPAAPAANAAQAPQTANPLPAAAQSLSVVVRDGTPYLVSDTRLYAVGQTVGGVKIERITETEVWLRSGKQLQKIQRFSGIQRRAAQP